VITVTRLFGTNGIRGIVNKDMTCELSLEIGKAWGTFLHKKIQQPSIVIGTDARLSNNMIKNSITAGFLATGCHVTDIGIVPTPSLQYTVREKHYHSGAMITASHNPPEYNGIKGIDSDGTEFAKTTEESIEEIDFNKEAIVKSWNHIGDTYSWSGANDLYSQGIISHVDSELIKKHHFHIVLDCGSGAGSVVTPNLLMKLGCDVTQLYCEPDGHFPGHPSEPVPENVTELIRTVKETNADFGVVQDGDADRAIFIDEHGEYIWGDRTLSLFSKYITKKKPHSIIVTPVTSSTSIDDVVRENNGRIIRTKVGSPVVARTMKETEAVFGGEENGGLIFPDFQFCRDSTMTIVKLIELLSMEHRSLSELLSEIPKYETVKTKVSCSNSLKESLIQCIINEVKINPNIINIDTTDGIKFYFPSGWVLMRPSGTEPIFRIYTESKSQKEAIELSNLFVNLVLHYRKKLEKK